MARDNARSKPVALNEPYEMSDYDKIRAENIRRNNMMLANLGFPNVDVVSKDTCGSRREEDGDDENDYDDESDADDDDANVGLEDVSKIQKMADLEEPACDTVSQYQYLLHTTHYDSDEEDSVVFRFDRIEPYAYKDGVEIVVYRSKFNENTRQWSQTNTNDPITAVSVAKLSKNARNGRKMRAILDF